MKCMANLTEDPQAYAEAFERVLQENRHKVEVNEAWEWERGLFDHYLWLFKGLAFFVVLVGFISFANWVVLMVPRWLAYEPIETNFNFYLFVAWLSCFVFLWKAPESSSRPHITLTEYELLSLENIFTRAVDINKSSLKILESVNSLHVSASRIQIRDLG